MSARKVVIAAGGTGGHFYPGLVLAQTLRERGWQPLMLVRRGDAALPTLEREAIAACEVDLAGLPRRPSRQLFTFAAKLLGSLALLRRVLKDFRPDAVAGMGGYLTFPAVAAAAWAGVPRVLHESNAVLGLANRACAALGAELYWGLPPFHGGGTVCGTPIRPALWKAASREDAARALGLDAGRPTVLVFGGSQGARGINRQAPAALSSVARALAGGLQVIHLAGRGSAAEVEPLYAGAPIRAVVKDFWEAMELAYAAADAVVCRSGASTLAELCAQRKPAVLVPYPAAAAGHQEANARVLERCGAAQVVLERDIPARLAGVLADLLSSAGAADRRKDMARAYERLGLPAPQDCAQRLADAVERAART